MKRFNRRPGRHKAIETMIKQHPELRPRRAKAGAFQGKIAAAPSSGRKGWVTEAERDFARLLDRIGIAYTYEPFTLAIGNYGDRGTIRSFQPDFWLPELGLAVELCARVQAKNQKLRLTERSWPALPVLVLADSEVAELGKLGLTKWGLVCELQSRMQAQEARVAREGDDPHGYRAGRRQGRRLAAAR
jgi:hypothetical protein